MNTDRYIQFTIGTKLPSLNDYINACRTNPHVGAKLKKDTDEIISWYIISKKLKPIVTPVNIRITWYESSYRRDPDNIYSSIKYILDALVKQGILPNDSRKYVKSIYHDIEDAKSDYSVVELMSTTQ